MDPKIKTRGSTKQPADSKAAKKKKKATTVASNLPVPPNSTNPIRTASAVPIAATTAATSAEQEHPPVTTTTTAPPVAATNSKTTIGGTTNISNRPLVDQVLYRLTEGVPRMELKAVVREADECERALLQELQLLEEALKEETSRSAGNAATKDTTEPQDDAALEKENAVNAMLQTPLTPLDRSFTLSSLLGRLRDELALPSIRRPTPAAVAAAGAASNKKKKGNTNPAPTYPQLVALADHPKYTRAHPPADNNNNAPPPQLMQVWRKISSHRASTVFRKAVKPEEAPGYTDRILFPMDLSLVRKMIQARILTSFAEVHQKLRLISHNCVKYNGRYVTCNVIFWGCRKCIQQVKY